LIAQPGRRENLNMSSSSMTSSIPRGRWRIAALLALALALAAASAWAQDRPAFLFEPLLDTYFDDSSGLIVFHAAPYDLAFPTKEPLNATVAVVDAGDTVIASFPFRERYLNRTDNGVIARAALDGTAEVTLTEPGVYNIVFLIDGTPVSRLPVVLERIEIGEDPFERETVYRYHGLWPLHAHITNGSWKGEDWPALTFWAGMRDFSEQAHQQAFFVEMKRNGEVVAHSRRSEGTFSYKHYHRVRVHLYHPHDDKSSANAVPVLRDEWMQDGDYEITVTRQADGATLRRFHYSARGGRIQPLPETVPGYQPAIDSRVPRVLKKGSSGYEFVEAIWISSNHPSR